MKKNPKTKTDWATEKNRLLKAGEAADALVELHGLAAPIDLFAIIRSEAPLLRAGGRNFGNRFDGMLEYHREKNRFLLFFNTKYDVGLAPGTHHPRTRFSIGHELGHYFLDQHRAHLMRSRQTHHSFGEFRSDAVIEREADSFAASVLLPSKLIRPLINQSELSVSRIRDVARQFNVSLLCATFRSVALSDFPCAVAGIRGGRVSWMFPSVALLQAGIFPGQKVIGANAQEQWASFQVGVATHCSREGRVEDWFKVYSREDLEDVYVTEEYVPMAGSETLMVLLTLDESDIEAEEETTFDDEV